MICTVNADGWCERHKRLHVGRSLELSQEKSRRGERYRQKWDRDAGNPQVSSVMLKPARTLECVHLGDVLDNRGCNCPWKQVRECDLYGQCTRGDGSLGLQTCQDCGDYSAEPIPTAKPDKVVRVNAKQLADGSAHFNCSILDWQGKTLLAYRTDWIGSTIHIAELGPDWQPTKTTPVNIRHPLAEGGAEDPRLFTFGEQLWLSVTGARIASKGSGVEASPLLCQLDPEYQPWQVIAPQYAARTWPMEKNWTYFEHDGTLHCVYSIHPHKILRLTSGQATLAHETNAHLQWAGGLLRGGASPVLHNGEWYCFFHGKKDMPGKCLYTIGCYTFADKPPFTVTRLTPFPLLIPEGRTTPPANPASIAFPCGAIRHGGQWVCSYGYQDIHSELAFFDEAKVERALRPV